MSSATTDTLVVDPVVLGEALAAAMHAAPGLRVQAIEDGDVPIPNDPRILSLGLTSGRIVLLVAPALARQMDAGDGEESDLAAAADGVLRSGADAIGFQVSGPAAEVDGDQAAPGSAENLVAAVTLFDGDAHAATVLVVLSEDATPAVAPHEFAPLPEASPRLAATGLELLHEVEMGVTAELGRTQMLVREVLSLSPGSVIELDRAAGSPVDVLVNGTLIARGEVVVIDEEFGIRITEVLGYEECQTAPR